jgi:hypothetical protein
MPSLLPHAGESPVHLTVDAGSSVGSASRLWHATKYRATGVRPCRYLENKRLGSGDNGETNEFAQ